MSRKPGTDLLTSIPGSRVRQIVVSQLARRLSCRNRITQTPGRRDAAFFIVTDLLLARPPRRRWEVISDEDAVGKIVSSSSTLQTIVRARLEAG